MYEESAKSTGYKLLALYLAVGITVSSLSGAYFSYEALPEVDAIEWVAGGDAVLNIIFWILAGLGLGLGSYAAYKNLKDQFVSDLSSGNIWDKAVDYEAARVELQVAQTEANNRLVLSTFSNLKVAFLSWYNAKTNGLVSDSIQIKKYGSKETVSINDYAKQYLGFDFATMSGTTGYGGWANNESCFVTGQIRGNDAWLIFISPGYTCYPFSSSAVVINQDFEDTINVGRIQYKCMNISGGSFSGEKEYFRFFKFTRSSTTSNWGIASLSTFYSAENANLDVWATCNVFPSLNYDTSKLPVVGSGFSAIDTYGGSSAIAVPDEVPVISNEKISDIADTLGGIASDEISNGATADAVNAAVNEELENQIGSITNEDTGENTGENTSGIIGWLEKIYNKLCEIAVFSPVLTALQTIAELVRGIPGTIVSFKDMLSEVPDNLTAIKEQLLLIPQKIADALGGQSVVVTDMPDVIIGNPEDVASGTDTGVMEGLLSGIKTRVEGLSDTITSALSDFFTVDTAAIDSTVSARISDVEWIDLDAKAGLFKIDHTFSQEYPVLTMKTPAIIKKVGYEHDEITLFDGKDYATYFVWVRRLLNAFIIVSYAYMVLKKFKVRFMM